MIVSSGKINLHVSKFRDPTSRDQCFGDMAAMYTVTTKLHMNEKIDHSLTSYMMIHNANG